MTDATPTVESVLRAAAAHAEDVDRNARFPKEAIDAAREAGLLGALVPIEHGGLGLGLIEVASQVRAAARHCGSTAMILAMHHIQVAALAAHGGTEELARFTARVAAEQLLLASATTEIGIGGDVRSSTCHVAGDESDYVLDKTAPVISYGEFADAILVTARRDQDSPPGDQVLVVSEHTELEEISGWDTLGFRGTCSKGYRLHAAGPRAMICADPYAAISAHTMLPVSHLLWASVWLGMADEAVDRARKVVQRTARRTPGSVPPGAARMVPLLQDHQQLAATIKQLLDRYSSSDEDDRDSLDFALKIGNLKITASERVVDIVRAALLVCGIAGYREDSDVSLGRLIRDSLGAAVMVNNDRIAAHNASLVLTMRGESLW